MYVCVIKKKIKDVREHANITHVENPPGRVFHFSQCPAAGGLNETRVHCRQYSASSLRLGTGCEYVGICRHTLYIDYHASCCT